MVRAITIGYTVPPLLSSRRGRLVAPGLVLTSLASGLSSAGPFGE